MAATVAAAIARSTSAEPIPDASGVLHACHDKPFVSIWSQLGAAMRPQELVGRRVSTPAAKDTAARGER